MRNLNIDVALTLNVTIPDNLAQQYRQLAFTAGDVKLARLSSELKEDKDFAERILHDNIRYVVSKALPQFLESGGFGVKVVPLALREAHVSDAEAKDDAQGELAFADGDDPDLKVGGTD